MNDRQSHVLVAGGAGFLGSHLCVLLLKEGRRVTCLDNLQTGRIENVEALLHDPAFAFVEADIVDPLPRLVADQAFDEIYNLACPASPPAYQRDPEHTMMTNVLGTRHLLRLAERTGARFLLTSTSEVYGDPSEHPQREEYRGNVSIVGPRACYDEGKRAAEALTFDFDRHGRAQVRVARIFNTYGPRLDPLDGRVVSNMVAQALAGRALTVYGTGHQTRSFCFVDDLVAGLLALMRYEGAQPGPVNIGNPAEVTMIDLAKRIADLTGSGRMVVHLPLPVDDPQRRRPDIGRAKALLGWAPRVDLDQGLRATIAWFADRETSAGASPMLALAV
ncbi:MAG: SDR family oxidoreductase [Sphingomonas sp.]|nr:MAG: SDR family oxidoreductase [Sphingomonas sp.]